MAARAGSKSEADMERTHAIVMPVLTGHTVRTAVLAAGMAEHLMRLMANRCVSVPTNGKVLNVTKMSTNAMTLTASMTVCLDVKFAITRWVALCVTAPTAGWVTTVEPKLQYVAMSRVLTTAGAKAQSASAPTVSVATTVK